MPKVLGGHGGKNTPYNEKGFFLLCCFFFYQHLGIYVESGGFLGCNISVYGGLIDGNFLFPFSFLSSCFFCFWCGLDQEGIVVMHFKFNFSLQMDLFGASGLDAFTIPELK